VRNTINEWKETFLPGNVLGIKALEVLDATIISELFAIEDQLLKRIRLAQTTEIPEFTSLIDFGMSKFKSLAADLGCFQKLVLVFQEPDPKIVQHEKEEKEKKHEGRKKK
jgi:hypothetical protein